MPTPTPIDPAERYHGVMLMRAAGMTYAAIAAALGVHVTRVGQIVRRGPPKPFASGEPVKLDRRRKYGRLRYLGVASKPKHGKPGQYGRFRCECGRTAVILARLVAYGNNTSCGCSARNQT